MNPNENENMNDLLADYHELMTKKERKVIL